jgi:hypothetical protein
MSEYRIEKLRRGLKLVLADGSRLDGDVFLQSVSRHRSRPEEPADLLNDADPFVALERNGDTLLVAKGQVRSVETEILDDDALETGVLGVNVELTTRDGALHAGSIFLEAPSDRPRLLDYLNAYHARFLPVVSPGRLLLINMRFIEHVREVA